MDPKSQTINDGIINFMNVGTGEDIKIRDLANLIANFSNFDGQIIWDKTKPDGTPRKLDISKLTN